LIPNKIASLLTDPTNTVYVSAISIWEIAIKYQLQKRDKPPFSAEQALRYFDDSAYILLDVTPRHAACVETLPLLHGDPFDRLLLGQALAEPMRLITHDKRVASYSDTVILF
jgi:PIN domain nuclease of toxin-antitoxin system